MRSTILIFIVFILLLQYNNAIAEHDKDSSIIFEEKVKRSLEDAAQALLRYRINDTYWHGIIYDTPGLTAQYILYMHFMDMVDKEREKKAVNYLLRIQNPNGSWRIYYGDSGELSYSIHCYFALKVAGVPADHPQMIKARKWILENGGIEKSNVETRLLLALFGQSSYNRAIPIPLRLLMQEKWFPFSMYNMAYWIRVTVVSMGVLYYKQVVKDLHTSIDELWLDISNKEEYTCPKHVDPMSIENAIFMGTYPIKWLMRAFPYDDITEHAMNWVLQHQDESGDIGGIYPPMMYGSFMLKAMGKPNSFPAIQKFKEAIERFQIVTENEIIQQSCVSPVWDTVWSMIALERSGLPGNTEVLKTAADWVYSRQIFKEGDWKIHAPNAKPGMWAFQFYNDYYPDTDDSAVALMALLNTIEDPKREHAFRAGVEWLYNMQNSDGGWAAFERNINMEIMKKIPLNDLNNYIDPSAPELTGRIIELFGRLGLTAKRPFIQRAVDSIIKDQAPFGGWKGVWGVHYIYGTFGVIRGLSAIGYNMSAPWIQKAISWLKSVQNKDGGWGESCKAYESDEWIGRGTSTASQTAWAILTLISCGERNSVEVRKGIEWLLRTQQKNGEWIEPEFTATGFPKYFYLRYDLYRLYFPVIALSEYLKNEDRINPYVPKTAQGKKALEFLNALQ